MYKSILKQHTEFNVFDAVIEDITGALDEEPWQQKNYSLFNGKLGIALYYFYLSKYSEKYKDYHAKALKIVQESIEYMNTTEMPHSLCDGFTGIAWILNHLYQNNAIEMESNESFKDLDKYIFNFAVNNLQVGNYDLLYGGLGAGVYFLSRLENAYAEEALVNIAHFIQSITIKDKDGAKWISYGDSLKGQTIYSLGLAHGVPSIIVFLSQLYGRGILKNEYEDLIDSGIQWLLKQRQDAMENLSLFPSYIIEGDDTYRRSRLAWCYGDLGVASALYQAGINCNNSEWVSIANTTMLHASHRLDPDKNDVVDASLCHGSSGIAHLFNRFYQLTHNEQFKEVSIYWYQETLKHRTFKDGLAGFKTWQGFDKEQTWLNEPSYLDGVAGIGLSILGAMSDYQPKWDSSILLS